MTEPTLSVVKKLIVRLAMDGKLDRLEAERLIAELGLRGE